MLLVHSNVMMDVFWQATLSPCSNSHGDKVSDISATWMLLISRASHQCPCHKISILYMHTFAATAPLAP